MPPCKFLPGIDSPALRQEMVNVTQRTLRIKHCGSQWYVAGGQGEVGILEAMEGHFG